VTSGGTYQQVREAAILPPPVRPAMPILVAAKGERMLRLTAELADAWQTAWFGLPDDRYRARRKDLLAACSAVGRDPATLDVTVGVSVDAAGGGPNSLPLDADAIAAAMDRWQAEGVDHLQLAVEPSTSESFATVLEAAERFRG
jgi:alkanesulfonate monooxygenase SsuD/methylene tetrahydromethanopterin reductase-like flavin-dependent oxidoreductase (luciferase family)